MVQRVINHLTTSYRYLVDRFKGGLTECAFIFDHKKGEWFFQYDNDEPVSIKIDRQGKEFTAYHYIRTKKRIKGLTITYIGKTIDFTLGCSFRTVWGRAFTDNLCPDYKNKEIVEFYLNDVRTIHTKYIQPIQTYIANNNDLITTLILACKGFAELPVYNPSIEVKDVQLIKEKKKKTEEKKLINVQLT